MNAPKVIKINLLGIVNLELDDLHEFQEDIKVLTEENYQRMRAEILADGFSFSPHVFLDSEAKAWILDGHQRKNCLRRMRDEEGFQVPTLPCMEVEAQSLEHARALVLAAASQFGTFQVKRLVDFAKKTAIEPAQLVKRFALPAIDLAKFVNVNAHVRKVGAEDEEDLPPRKEPRAKAGDIWELGVHRVMCGDSTNPEHVARLMNGERAALCFTSPPYVEQRDYSGELELSTVQLAKFLPAAAPHADFLAVNLGISRKDGEVNQYWDDYIAAARACGLKLLSWNIWDRGAAFSIGQQSAMFPIEHEWIFVFGKEKKILNGTVANKHGGEASGATNRQQDGSMAPRKHYVINPFRPLGTIVRIGVDKDRSVNHPAKFPAALPQEYILAVTNAGDAVLDPFGGSGSTLVAAEKNERRAFLMEIDPAYVDLIVDRWEKITQRKAKLV